MAPPDRRADPWALDEREITLPRGWRLDEFGQRVPDDGEAEQAKTRRTAEAIAKAGKEHR
jgi:hypothetical protein